MKIQIWLIIFCILIIGSSPYAGAMTKSEAKKLVKDSFQYYSPSRKATKIRKKTESVSLMQCHIGLSGDPKTQIITPTRLELIGYFKQNDKLASVNGVAIDWELDHPLGFWGSLDKLPIEKGDEISLVVQRENNKVQVKIPCLGERQTKTEFLEDSAVAFSKYKGKKFLDKWGSLSNDCQFSDVVHQVAKIAFNNRKIRKTDYNSYVLNEGMCILKYNAKKIESGHVIDSKAIAAIKNFVNYLLENGSPNMARKLESELDELVSYELTTQVVAENKGLAKNKMIESNFEENEAVKEMISSAFGIKLGSTFVETKVKIGSTSGEIPLYRLTPKNPVSSLKNYSVILTPKSDQIVEIWAWNKFSDSAKCKETLKQIEAALDRKYLPLKNESTFGGMALYSEGERTIIANCPITFGSDPLYLQYKDKTQDALRISEKNESENLQGL